MGAPHLPLIVELHAEDAAILWLQRDRAVDAPHYNREFLGRLDERLEANLDGLRIAADAGWAEALRAFEAHPEPGEMFVLAALAFGGGQRDRIEAVLAGVIADPTGALVRPAISALGWLRPDELSGKVQPLLSHPSPSARLLGVGACSVHRVDPRDQLPVFLGDVASVRARALRLAGEIGRADLLPAIVRHLDDEDEDCRFHAAWSAALLGERRGAPQGLREHAETRTRHLLSAFDLALRTSDLGPAREWLKSLGRDPEALLLQVRGAGVLGDPSAIPWLIDRMSEAPHARVAAESFTMITGTDIELADLDGPPPRHAKVGPNDDPKDEETQLDPDEDLPWPDPVGVERWWNATAVTLPRPRCFLGGSWDDPQFERVYASGFQRQRRAAAFNLALRSPGSKLRSWDARTKWA